jgi:predicted nucleic acid-binding protein
VRSLFLDSNVVVKYYYSEEGSTWVRRLVDAEETVCFVSLLAIVEVPSALSLHNLPDSSDYLFVSGDQQVLNAAKLEGLNVADPADHRDEDQTESDDPARHS